MFSMRVCEEEDFESIFSLNKLNFFDYVERIRGWDENIEIEDNKRTFRPRKDFVLLIDEQETGYLAYDVNSNEVHLRIISIHPKYQRMGIGQKVINKLMHTHNLPIRLEVTTDNYKALSFYKNLGFEIMEEFEIKKAGKNRVVKIKKYRMQLNERVTRVE